MGEKATTAGTIDDFVNPEKDDAQRNDALNTLLMRIHSGGLTLHQLVENMADYLPSKDEVVRGRATLLLSEVISRLPELRLGEGSLHFLAAFYADRLQDFPSLSEVLKGILALLENHALREDDIIAIIRSITSEVVDQGYMLSLSQPSRMLLLQIFSIILEKHKTAARLLKADFVFSFLRVLDGERDPRNLLVGFKTFVSVVNDIPEFVRFAEELFEIVSVYFPVTFTPKPNDPYGITKEALVEHLRACFAASAVFAPFSVPFLLDKESSTITETKLEALETLSLCAERYGSLTMSKYVEDIWPALRTEVLTTKEGHVVEKALETVTRLTVVLSSHIITVSSGTRNFSSNLREFLDPLINQCLHELRSPDSKIAISCGKILHSAAIASVRACEEILKETLPVHLRHFTAEERPSHRQSLLDLIISFITASCQFPGLIPETHPLRPYCNQLFTAFSGVFASDKVLGSSKFKLAAITGLRSLLLADLLNSSESEIVLLLFTKAVMSDNDAVVRSNALRALDLIAHQAGKAALVEQHTLPSLLNAITTTQVDFMATEVAQPRPEEEEHREEADGKGVTSVLGALTVLASEPSLCHFLVPRLLNIAESQWAGIREVSLDGRPHSLPARILEALSRVINAPESQNNASEWKEAHCPRILKLFINETSTMSPTSTGSIDFQHALNSTVRIFGAVTRKLESGSVRSEFVDAVITLFLHGKSPLFSHDASIFQPFDAKAPIGQRLLVKVLTAVIGSADRDRPISSAEEVLHRLYSLIYVGSNATRFNEMIALSASQGLAAMINKLADDSPVMNDLSQILPELRHKLKDPSTPFQEKADALRALAWLAKALVMKGHPKGKEVAIDIISLLPSIQEEGNKKISILAAQAIDVIIGESENILNANTSSRIRVLYKQRFFTEMMPPLLQGFNNAAAPMRSPYLLAISYLLKHIPKSVLLSELPTVMPLIVQSVSSQDPGLISSTLKTLSMLVVEAPDMVGQHLSAFIPELLRLSTFKDNMSIRVAALECLSSFLNLPFYKIFPYQKKVINELGRPLDDPKRAVRKVAVKCRNQWFAIKTENTALRKPGQ